MYFWKIESLKDDIRNQKFTEKGRFIYALISVAVSVAGLELMTRIPLDNPNIWDTLDSLCAVGSLWVSGS
ncbi:hypothetical protein [Endozoicomonas arenosclerae]|uniref:hypothetical protein n=1 Tax=Endozoicomonas arenosclerae TaxID=1633495 RepID=UPI0007839C30|nr:hypothetical protein [Endozoicomonas arenosclerae]